MHRLRTIITAAIAIASLAMGSGRTAYRVVSFAKDGARSKERRMIVRRDDQPPRIDHARILWEELPSRVLALPLNVPGETTSLVVIAIGDFPPIEARVEISEPEPARFPTSAVVVRRFSIRGLLPQGGEASPDEALVDALEKVGARSISIDGDGMALLDVKRGRTLGGRMRLARRIEPALWRKSSEAAGLSSEMEMAWSIMP